MTVIKETGPNNRKALNNSLRWLWDLLSFFSNEEILVPSEFHEQVAKIKDTLRSDTSGLVNSILDFAINCAYVDFTVETDSPAFTNIIESWFKIVNKELIGKVPVGIKELSKEYHRESWKNSSLLVLRTVWQDIKVDGIILNLPTKMWFVDGQNVEVEDKSDTRIIGEEKYYLKINDKDRKSIPTNKEELLFIQKPFSSWSDLYPTPYLIQRGLYKNLKFYELVNKKAERIVGKALEYMFLMKKGTERLALEGSAEYTYSQEDMQNLKSDFKKWQTNNKAEPGVPSYFTNFDTEVSHLIPEYETVLKKSLYEQIEKRLLQGLGLIDVVDMTSSSRRESVLNPRPFIAEVENGITNFSTLLTDILTVVKDRNEKQHPKLFGNKMQLHFVPIKHFINDNIRDHLRSMYDRGVLSKQTYGEVVGEIDIDIEETRRKEEKEKKFEETFYPPVIQNTQPTQSQVVNKPNDNTPDDKKGLEKRNYKGSEEEILEESKIVKQKDGYYVLSEKTGKSLGGPYKTKKEAVRRLQEIEYWKTHDGEIEIIDEVSEELVKSKLEIASKQKKLLDKILKEKND